MALSQEGRNYGIDALRIVSMWMVVILHILDQGGILSRLTLFSAKYEAAWFLETMAYCAVNCYALISGYVGLYSKFKPSNLFYLWFEVFFYSILISLGFALILPKSVGLKELLTAFFPVMTDQYWYFTAYFALFFFTPFLNYLIKSLPKKYAIQLVVSLMVIFSVIPTLRHDDVFYTKYGYSVIWLAILYIIGAYVKKYGVHESFNNKWFALYMVFVIVSWGVRWPIEALTNWKMGEPHMGHYLTEYTSPTIVGSAFALFMMFSNMKIDSKQLRRIISSLAPLSFGIYLIHTHPLVWDYLLNKHFIAYADKSLIACVILVLITAVCIVIACMGIDAIRKKLFDVFRVRKYCDYLQQRMVYSWNRLFE